MKQAQADAINAWQAEWSQRDPATNPEAASESAYWTGVGRILRGQSAEPSPDDAAD